MASFSTFLENLFTQGAVVLTERPSIDQTERQKAADLLALYYADYRLEVAGPLISFDEAMALSAAERVWFACWFLVERSEEPAEMEKCLTLPEPPTTASRHLSADLLLRFLPQVYRRARALDGADLLTGWLSQLLRLWPLSGVLADLEQGPLNPVVLDHHPGLLLLYAERLARNPRPAWTPPGPGLDYVELVMAERGLRAPPTAAPALVG
jgi:hypothetical protein